MRWFCSFHVLEEEKTASIPSRSARECNLACYVVSTSLLLSPETLDTVRDRGEPFLEQSEHTAPRTCKCKRRLGQRESQSIGRRKRCCWAKAWQTSPSYHPSSQIVTKISENCDARLQKPNLPHLRLRLERAESLGASYWLAFQRGFRPL